MNTEEEAREVMATQRQKASHLHETMGSRLVEEVETPSDPEIEAEARQAMVEHRHHAEHVQQTMRRRTEAEVGLPESSEPNA